MIPYHLVHNSSARSQLCAGLALLLCAPCVFGATLKYSATLNKIYVQGGGSATLTAIHTALPTAPLSEVDPVNQIWLLGANVVIQDGCTLVLHGSAVGGDVNQLRIQSLNSGAAGGFVYVEADYGTLDINATKITSWDPTAGGPDTNSVGARAYLLARSSLSTNGVTPQNSTLFITNSEISFLGSTNSSDLGFGVVWKVSGVDPNPATNTNGVFVSGNVVNSLFHDNYMGAYAFGATNMLWLTNQFYNNAQDGLSLDDYSSGHQIWGNALYNNAEYGLSVSHNCGHATMLGNSASGNANSGIVLGTDSDASIVQDNQSFNNGGSGISIDQCASNTVQNNLLYGNAEAGLRVTLGSSDNLILNNQSATNKYGLYGYIGSGTPAPGDDGHPKRNVFGGNVVHDNTGEPILFTNCDYNTLTTNSFTDLSGKLRFQGSVSNWLEGNSIPTNMYVVTESDTNVPASTYVRNQPYLNVQLGTNAQTIVEDAQGRIYQTKESSLQTDVSGTGSVLTLTPAGIGTTTTVIGLNFWVSVTSGNCLVDNLVWTNATSLQWTTLAGFYGQGMTFTIGGLAANTLYSVTKVDSPLTNVLSNASGQIQFQDSATSVFAVNYVVSIPALVGPRLYTSMTANGLAISWTVGSATLQATTNLISPNWQTVPTTNGQDSVFINPVLPMQFFRLVQP